MSSYPKIYFTWYIAPEDPRYWRYFRINGIVVSMKSILELRRRNIRLYNSLLTYGFKRVYGYNGFLLIDSLTTRLYKEDPLDILSQNNILYLQYLMGSDILVNKDYPLVGVRSEYLRHKLLLKNIRLAELSVKLADRMGKDIMLIIQGWDLDSYLYCTRIYRDLGVKYIGIGSLVPHRSNPGFTVRVARKIRDIVGSNVWIHLFGIAGWNVINKLRDVVNSVDTSTPMRAASNREAIIYDNGLKRIKISSFEGFFIIKERLNSTSDEIEYRLLKRIIESKDFISQRKYLAIYNAYTILKSYGHLMH